MIKLTRLDRQEIAINCDLIVWLEARPDTTVRLLAGESILVRESVDEVIQRMVSFRSKVLRDAGLGAAASGAHPAATSTLEAMERDEDESTSTGTIA
jgi:flagellar protein FlbD